MIFLEHSDSAGKFYKNGLVSSKIWLEEEFTVPKLLDPKLTRLLYLPELCKFILSSQGGSENAFYLKHLLICGLEHQREIETLEYARLDLKGKFNLKKYDIVRGAVLISIERRKAVDAACGLHPLLLLLQLAQSENMQTCFKFSLTLNSPEEHG